MVPVAPIITGITFVFTFHMRCISTYYHHYYHHHNNHHYYHHHNNHHYHILKKLEFSGKIFEKYTLRFHEKPSSWRVGERSDRRDEASGCFLRSSSTGLKFTLNLWTWKWVEPRAGLALSELVKMQWVNGIIYVIGTACPYPRK
jgi:hypothetical protein